jgi:GWxTD domain-containing protein
VPAPVRAPFAFWSLALLAVARVALAAPEAEGPLPWQAEGRPSFTVDAASHPDSAGWRLDVFVRIPPEPLGFILQDGENRARVRLTIRLENRFGAKLHDSRQEFDITRAEQVSGFGHVVTTRFPVKPGEHRLEVRLEDLHSRRRGLAYLGRNVPQSAEVEGPVVVPGAQAEVELGDLKFLWQSPTADSAALAAGAPRTIPNPERLFGLFATQLRAAFVAEGAASDQRPWRWHARVQRGKDVVANSESSQGPAARLEGLVDLDISTLPPGGYELELKVWREGSEAAAARRGRFSIAWLPESWQRSPTEVEDEVHFLFDEDAERSFVKMMPGEQEAFLEDFWKRRDPSPETADNELRATFMERVAYANEHFGYKKIEKGMFTDMGRVFIRYGLPSDIEKEVIPAGDRTLTQVVQELALTEDTPIGNVRPKGSGGDLRPFELWTYDNVIPLPLEVDPERVANIRRRDKIVFLFVDEQGYGHYTLRYTTE